MNYDEAFDPETTVNRATAVYEVRRHSGVNPKRVWVMSTWDTAEILAWLGY